MATTLRPQDKLRTPTPINKPPRMRLPWPLNLYQTAVGKKWRDLKAHHRNDDGILIQNGRLDERADLVRGQVPGEGWAAGDLQARCDV